MMIITVSQYRELSGDSSVPPTDADITLALNRYGALIEGYTGRRFSPAACSEVHYKVGNGPLQLNTFPVSAIAAISVDGEVQNPLSYTVHKASGLIYHEGEFSGSTVEVEYTGGYTEAPYEVKIALVTLISAYLAGTHGGVESLSPGKKEVVAGVGSIDYGSSASQLVIFGTPYAELGPYTSVLEKYREPGLA